ncbi:hypothetical protein ZHAS_00014136 [Anopheles sinensis]|uniref:Uncharacterized protein n=1 Tax=Anopheles sinensis TaxID=74873 RepID=A0A084W7Q3_ANOSI|nr:hypothetical protein ZHAS_00014136 [Anopheles sinensis]
MRVHVKIVRGTGTVAVCVPCAQPCAARTCRRPRRRQLRTTGWEEDLYHNGAGTNADRIGSAFPTPGTTNTRLNSVRSDVVDPSVRSKDPYRLLCCPVSGRSGTGAAHQA